MYAPDYAGGNLPYALFYTEKRLGGGSLPSLQKGMDIALPIRRVGFQGSTSQVLVIHMPQNGCLRVLDPARGDEVTYGRQSRFLAEAIPLSDLSNILPADQTPRIPFFTEPEHTWCYYYAKAELAYQHDDLDQVIGLIDKATALGYDPEDPFEWLTYIEAQAIAGDLDAAEKISRTAMEQDNGIRRGLCEVWKRVQATDSGAAAARADQILSEIQCAR
jgi:hypothetical protein